MGKFEDQLLSDLMQVHGPDLAGAERPRRRRTNPVVAAVGAVAVAGVATGAVLMWPTSTPAYAVTDNGDGTVTVSVNNVSAVDKANREAQGKGDVPGQVHTCNAKPVMNKLESIDRKLKDAIAAEGRQKKIITVYLPDCPPQTIEVIPGRGK
ncbi:hypothetical protein [Kibdelosporangium phytohabitans]|uniref:Uncharacterized protein n=1 Tax=Kibdelosporangium phytohabitans TaxID=860235 RepID=A0A0N9I9L1_9PSEU|nr:hypothetical protein [Kibdelosporangium phytohabitans]ALG12685.1 hypothetical protein AOZ06_42735 [Kibdelosporangium phytohabitans]MBE1464343.1 hypothetical protein [Kibdelosporangium phytohabitans]